MIPRLALPFLLVGACHAPSSGPDLPVEVSPDAALHRPPADATLSAADAQSGSLCEPELAGIISGDSPASSLQHTVTNLRVIGSCNSSYYPLQVEITAEDQAGQELRIGFPLEQRPPQTLDVLGWFSYLDEDESLPLQIEMRVLEDYNDAAGCQTGPPFGVDFSISASADGWQIQETQVIGSYCEFFVQACLGASDPPSPRCI
jgi:hypothetical protein